MAKFRVGQKVKLVQHPKVGSWSIYGKYKDKLLTITKVIVSGATNPTHYYVIDGIGWAFLEKELRSASCLTT